jgi:hypothetical protein
MLSVVAALPTEVQVLVVVLGALLVMVGHASMRKLTRFVLLLAAFPVLVTLGWAIFGSLPLWAKALALAVVAIRGFMTLSSLLIGTHAANHLTGSLAADVVRGCFRFIIWPLRAVAAAVRGRRWP